MSSVLSAAATFEGQRESTVRGMGGAALATVVGVLIEVPLMLLLVRFCQRTRQWFPGTGNEV